MIGLLLVLGLALAQEGEPVDVRRSVASDATVNWTTLALEVRAMGYGGATLSKRAVEELARRDADAGIQQGVQRIQVSDDRTVADLRQVPEFGGPLEVRISRWRASETRYFSSGRVEVDAELSLADLLKPYTLATAKQPDLREGPEPRYTGVVVDARGLGVEPAWSPQILSATGDLLYDGTVLEAKALDTAPVVYVSDPAHPAAIRAGDDPIFLRADSASGSKLTLTPEDSQRFRTTLVGAPILREGKVVLVVDAE